MKLPNKMSDLLRLAVADAKLIEKDPRYQLDMYVYHLPKYDQPVCRVCMAGAVMARSLGCDPRVVYSTGDFGPDDTYALRAIDQMRRGWFDEAAAYLNIDIKPGALQAAVEMAADAIDFDLTARFGRVEWVQYEAAAQILADAGL